MDMANKMLILMQGAGKVIEGESGQERLAWPDSSLNYHSGKPNLLEWSM